MKELKKIEFADEILTEEETMEILGGSGNNNYSTSLCQGCVICTSSLFGL